MTQLKHCYTTSTQNTLKMKTFKKILLGFIFVIITLVVIAFFLPREVHIERSGSIHAPAKVVFGLVNNLHTWEKWSIWNQIDPEMDITYENSGIGKNASYTWNSENSKVGQGKLTITESIPYDSIATEMDFMEEGTAMGYFLFKENGGATDITWAFNSDLGNNPFARWMGLMFNTMIGPDFENGIANLKVVSETIVQEKQPIVEIISLPDFNFVSLRSEIKLEDISTQMGMMYGQLMNFMGENRLTMTDMPYAIYHKMDGGLIDLECGIPVDKAIDPRGSILAGIMPGKTYASADHFGSYETLEKTHSFIQKWIQDNGFNLAGSPMEKYLTDPQKEPDQTKWVTAIYYPVQ